MKFIRLFIIPVIFFSIVFASYAAEKKDSSLEVSPAYVEISLEKPAEVQKLELEYTNHSPNSISLQIFPVDFKQADDLGTVQLMPAPGSYSYSLSSFLSLESDTLLLEPGQKKVFTVTITNRQDLSPGGHYAAIVAKFLTEGKKTSDEPQVQPAVSSLILLRKVGGERFNLSLKDISWPNGSFSFEYPRQINVTFQNEGNIHVIPYGRIDVHDMFGRLIYKGIINTGSLAVFPESRRHIYVDLDTVERGFPISLNTLSIDGADSLKKTPYAYKETFIYVNPAFIGIIFVLIVVFIWLNQRRKHH